MSDDKHVTRTGDDYAYAMKALLPLGPAWPRDEDSVLMRAIRGLSLYWGDFEISASVLLERESDPRRTLPPMGDPLESGLLPDWERNWGLPDPCYTAPLTIAERQAELVRRMTIEGAQSRAFFIGLAAQLGYTITISEYRVFVVGIDRVGDSRTIGDGSHPMYNEWNQPILDPVGNPVEDGELSGWPQYGLGPPSNRFYWTVHVQNAKLVWFRATSGECGVDPHLRIGLADDLECLLNRWKPAHTQIIFDYSGLETGGPMAGTP